MALRALLTPDRNRVMDTDAHRTPVPELLAPAGGRQALIAAVNNGADAVYLGLRDFNARRGAENFDLETLRWACDFAHLRDVRVYLAANVLIMPEEMHDALTAIDEAWAAGVDAVIVQDLGLARAVRSAMPDVRLHASTQMDIHDAATASALADLGFARITLARETPLQRIAAIVRASGVEVETFVHGALCFSYSGQCLLSSAIGGRSANRGLCAQPCRLPYDLLVDGRVADTPGRYLLSPKDVAAIERIPDLVRAGVSALKIEGRAKAPEYVAVVTSVYRAALDRFATDPGGFSVLASELAMLEEAFSRGFTDAYLDGLSGNEMMAYLRPNNRGVPVGRVVRADGMRVSVALERALDAEDTIEFWTSRGRHAQRVGAMRARGARVLRAPDGETVEIEAQRPAARGDRVFRVANAALLEAARRTFEPASALDVRATPVDLAVTLRIGQPARLEARGAGASVVVDGPVVERARSRPVTAEDVVEHVGRMGGSGYRPSSWEIELDPDANVGFSVLHRMRRQALSDLDRVRLSPWKRRTRTRPHAPALRGPAERTLPPRLVVVASTPTQATAAMAAGADEVYLRLARPDDLQKMPPGVWPALPRVVGDVVDGEWLAAGAPERALAGTLGTLAALAGRGVLVDADWPLNAANQWTVVFLRDSGAARVWLSPELSASRLAAVIAGAPVKTGVLVGGRLELMIAQHCVLQAAGTCAGDCSRCSLRSRDAVLKDRKGYGFPVRIDNAGRSHLYNSVPLDLARVLHEIVSIGVAAVRIDLTVEDEASARRVVEAARSALGVATAGSQPSVELYRPSTSGHYFRDIA